MDLPIYWVDAFTDRAFGGNPAAVIPLESWPDDGLLPVSYTHLDVYKRQSRSSTRARGARSSAMPRRATCGCRAGCRCSIFT